MPLAILCLSDLINTSVELRLNFIVIHSTVQLKSIIYFKTSALHDSFLKYEPCCNFLKLKVLILLHRSLAENKVSIPYKEDKF